MSRSDPQLSEIQNTASDAEDAGGATGWSINNSSLFRNFDSAGNWTSFGESKEIRFYIQ